MNIYELRNKTHNSVLYNKHKLLRKYFSILYNNGSFSDLTKTCVIQLYNFNFYNYVNLVIILIILEFKNSYSCNI